jgi:outer membrane protein assembly factor BamB
MRVCLLLCCWLWGIAWTLGETNDWPQFLGPHRNGVYDAPALDASWPKEGPPLRWKKEVGQGFSGPVVQQGKLIVFHRLADKEVLDCLHAGDGRPVWHFEYSTSYHDDFGFDEGPRATPALGTGKVYSFGAEGVLSCLDLQSGRLIWSLKVKERLHAPKGFFGIACSPILHKDKVLLNVGGTPGAGIVAFDANNGKLVWQCTDDEASYSSPVDAEVAGQGRTLFFTRTGLVAVDPDNGHVHFQFRWRSRGHASVNAATPLVIGDLVFLSASYETGAILLQMKPNDALNKIWSSDDALSNHYATSVYADGFLYGFHGRQEFGQSLRCIELRTGRVQWTQDRFGAGTILLAKEKLLVLKENGELLLLNASPKAYGELARAQVLPGTVRAYPALAGGFLFARNKDQLSCIDLNSPQRAP